MLEGREDARLAEDARAFLASRLGDAQHLERHVTTEVAVAREIDRPHTSFADPLDDLVAHGRALRPLDELPQMRNRSIGESIHVGSMPSSARASARNSSSLPERSRNVSSTNARKSRRVVASQLVTCVAVIPRDAASSAYVGRLSASPPAITS